MRVPALWAATEKLTHERMRRQRRQFGDFNEPENELLQRHTVALETQTLYQEYVGAFFR